MAQNEIKYRDTYVLIDLFGDVTPYANEAIFLDIEGDAYIKDEEGQEVYIGEIDCFVEDVLSIDDLLYTLRKDKVCPVNSDKAAFVNANDVKRLDITQGVCVATQNGLAIVYCGVVELGDEWVTVDIYDHYEALLRNQEEDEEEERYVVTEKGLKYLAELTEQLCEDICTSVCPEEREENSTMDNLFGNLGFGKVKGDRFKLSMNGIAVAQNNGKYVVFNKESNEFVDVSSMLFDIKDALFLLPAVEVNAGDTVLHEGKAYFVVDTTNEIKAVDYETCTQTVLIPKSTMFGIKYFQKVFSMFGDNFAAAGDLFSNPMMLMALMEGKNSDLTQMMLFNSMSNGDLGSNPMALAMMLKGDNSSDSLSTIALMSMFNNGTNPFAPKKAKTNKKETNTTSAN